MQKNTKNIFVSNSIACKNFSYTETLEKYAVENDIQIYILSAPLLDNKYK